MRAALLGVVALESVVGVRGVIALARILDVIPCERTTMLTSGFHNISTYKHVLESRKGNVVSASAEQSIHISRQKQWKKYHRSGPGDQTTSPFACAPRKSPRCRIPHHWSDAGRRSNLQRSGPGCGKGFSDPRRRHNDRHAAHTLPDIECSRRKKRRRSRYKRARRCKFPTQTPPSTLSELHNAVRRRYLEESKNINPGYRIICG